MPRRYVHIGQAAQREAVAALDAVDFETVEIEVRLFSRQCLGKRRIPDLAMLRQQARAWNPRVNRESAWSLTGGSIVKRLERRSATKNNGINLSEH